MNKPLLSFIIPVYNKENYLEDCIKSVISDDSEINNQLEIILIDDGSNDRSKDICDDFEKKYRNVFCWHFSKNSGAGMARNEGIKKANGKYCFFLDADDTIKKEKLPYILKILNSGYEYPVICFMKQFTSIGSISGTLPVYEMRIDDLLESTPDILLTSLWYYIFSLDFLKRNSILCSDANACEDLFMANKVLLTAEICLCINEKFYNYSKYVSDGLSFSINYLERYRGRKLYIDMLKEYESILDSKAKKEAVRQAKETMQTLMFFDPIPTEHCSEMDELYKEQMIFANKIRMINNEKQKDIILCPVCEISLGINSLLNIHGVHIRGFADNNLSGNKNVEKIIQMGYSVKYVKKLNSSNEFICICHRKFLTDVLSEQLIDMGMQKDMDFCCIRDYAQGVNVNEEI